MKELQEQRDEDLSSESCYFLCYTSKESSDIYFKCGWGDEAIDVQNFAFMLSKINSGDYENNILDVLKLQTGDSADFELFMQLYAKYKANEKLDLVVPPSMAHLK